MLIQNWVVYHIQIIGEACRAISADFRAQHPEVPWTEIIGMRNILVHHYFGIDFNAVWSVVEHDLPDLKRAIAAMLGEQSWGNPPRARGWSGLSAGSKAANSQSWPHLNWRSEKIEKLGIGKE